MKHMREKTKEESENIRCESVTKIEERMRALQKANTELKIEIRRRKRVENKLKKINDELNDFKKAISNVLQDLHFEKNNAEKEKAKDEAILASIADGCIAVNEYGEIILINRMAQKILGYSSKESIGKHWYEILRREDEGGGSLESKKGAICAALSKAAITTNTTSTADFYYIKKDGTRIPISRTVSPIILQGRVIGAVNIFRDITREKEIDKAKTGFISIASHQLRTPLTTVNWYVEMLLSEDEGRLNSKQKEYLNEVNRGSQLMVELVNALLSVARLEMGTFRAEPEPIDIVNLTQSEVNAQKRQINANKINFNFSFEKNIPAIFADPKLLRMVVQNLLSNSAKYTPEGGKIELSIFSDGKNNILLKISDTGYGIPKKQQEQIFTKFFRADNVREKNTEGTGLGLYIVKLVIENLGGKVWFKSEENKGTVFFVKIPLDGLKKKEPKLC